MNLTTNGDYAVRINRVISCFVFIVFFITNFWGCKTKDAGLKGNRTAKFESHDITIPEWVNVQVGKAFPNRGFNLWIPGKDFQTSSMVRVPRFPDPATSDIQNVKAGDVLKLNAVQNEQVPAQFVVGATDNISDLHIQLSDFTGTAGSTLKKDNIQARLVQYIPVERSRSEVTWSARFEDVAGRSVSGIRNPDVVGDPLMNIDQISVPAYHAQAVWLTFRVPSNLKAGTYKGSIKVRSKQYDPVTLQIELSVHDIKLPDPSNYSFHLDVWMNPNAVAAEYGVKPWSEDHWKLLRSYFRDLATHGQKNILTTILEKPWKIPWLGNTWRSQTYTGYENMVKWHLTGDDQWKFDYSLFDHYIQAALDEGVGPDISVYSMLAFRGGQRLTYYDDDQGKWITEQLNVEDERYRQVWSSFLRDFRDHLKQKGWLQQTWLCFDERPAHLMNPVMNLVKKAAPEFTNRISVAGSPDVDPYAGDLAIGYSQFPGNSSYNEKTLPVIRKRLKEGKPTRFYLAGRPAHPNTFTYSPAVESRMVPWIALKYGLDGFLRWSYNNWPESIYRHPVFNYIQGDEYYVYPGPDGPRSSIRWELLKDGIEDFELVKMLKENGRLTDEESQEIIKMATRNPDGREKDLMDMERARKMLFQHIK